MSFLTHSFYFSKYPDDARMKQFVRFYLEEKYKLEKKPLSDITEDVIERVFYWSELCYTFFMFFTGVEAIWWIKNGDFRNLPIPEDIDMFKEFTDPCLTEYYRMKEKLQEKRDKYQEKGCLPGYLMNQT